MIAPRHLRVSMMIVITRPNSVQATGTVVKLPRETTVPPPPTTMPPSTSPMNRMKKPMPITIAFFSSSGMALKIASRKPVSTRMRMATPSSTMRPMALSKLRPWPATRLNATTALSPMPGAMAKARLVTRPMRMVMTPATRQVDVSAAANGSPLPSRPRMLGFTKMM